MNEFRREDEQFSADTEQHAGQNAELEHDEAEFLANSFSKLRGVPLETHAIQEEWQAQRERQSELEKNPDGYWQLFAEASGASQADIEEAKRIIAELPPLPESPYEAAKTIRLHLAERLSYDQSSFTLSDLAKNKSGNCLGLAVLYGAILHEKGFAASYELLVNPKDKHDSDAEIFRMLNENQGDKPWDYDNPPLPDEQAKEPQGRFAPLEHPVLVLEGKRVETTRLDKEEIKEDEDWASDKEESSREISYAELLSCLHGDKIKTLIEKKELDDTTYEEIKKECEAAILLWPKNREVWHDLAAIAAWREDKELYELAKKRYADIGGDDSRFFSSMYDLFKDETYLDLALEKNPSHPFMFVEKRVVREKDKREARFNFAVAAFCVANSSVWDIRKFYQQHQQTMEKLFGKPRVQKLFSRMHLHPSRKPELLKLSEERTA